MKTAFCQIGELCNDIDVSCIEGKQLGLCKGNIIFFHEDCICLQENKRSEVFYANITLATASAKL